MKMKQALRSGKTVMAEDAGKTTRLNPIRKSGKEKRSFLREIEEEDDLEILSGYRKRESVLDYFDDEDPDEEPEDEEEEDPEEASDREMEEEDPEEEASDREVEEEYETY